MATSIFVNLPVKDLEASKNFYVKLGFALNEQFTDETAAAIVVSDTIYMMLLTYPKFESFTKKEVVDAKKSTEVLNALSVDSKDEVNEFVDKAVELGATEPGEVTDYGFMYTRSFDDLDGHTWEILWMDPAHVE